MADLKAELRHAALTARAAVHATARPGAAGKLSEWLAGWRGAPVAGYLPIRSEIDPRPAMAEASARGPVAVPVIASEAAPLRFALWEPEMALVPGPFGTLRPETPEFITPEIIIVPLVAFDRRGGRLGYGGGFYDRTLEALRASGPVHAAGFAYAAQEVEAVPLEPTDQPLDLIITERDVLEVG